LATPPFWDATAIILLMIFLLLSDIHFIM